MSLLAVIILTFPLMATVWFMTPVWAQERIHFQIKAKSLFVDPAEEQLHVSNHNSAYQRLDDIERQVYGREYSDQDDSQRITRLEQSVFGFRQAGNMDVRYQRIALRLNEKNLQSSQNNQVRMLDYMEQKLFDQAYATQSIPDRLNRLESQVFGKSFENYPTDIRFKKLSYALPVLSRGVKVSSRTSGQVVASTTNPVPVRSTATALPSYSADMRLDAAVHPREYTVNIYRLGAEEALRWQKLPVLIHFHHMSAENQALAKRAYEEWKQSFPIELADYAGEADIIVDGQATSAGVPVTRPVLQVDNKQHIRTTVVIQSNAFFALPEEEAVQAVTHQIGHALGIWGHSDDPNDVMYPAQSFEWNDIPSAWLRRSPKMQSDAPVATTISQRDRNTLRKLYEMEAQDLKTFVPSSIR